MLRLLQLCSFVLLLCTCVSAQNVDPSYNHVIAAGGLNLRAQPNTAASVIAAIPFGDQVNVFDPCDYGRDTLGYLKDYYRVHDHGSESDRYEDQVITGNWLRVAYGPDTGFVFSAYLWYDFTSYRDPSVPETDYVMISPGGGCGGDVYDPHAYHYYGVYQADHGQSELRAIDISFLAVVDEFEALLITTDHPRNLRFIIGSKRKLKPSTFTADYLDHPARLFPLQFPKEDSITGVTVPGISLDTIHANGNEMAAAVRFTQGTQQQTIPLDYPRYEISLAGRGDFDGDGKTDYLLLLHSEQTAFLNLYLSSAAEAGELVRLAAWEGFSCCC